MALFSLSEYLIYNAWVCHQLYTVGTIPPFNIKIVERDKIDILNNNIHDHSLPCVGTNTMFAQVT